MKEREKKLKNKEVMPDSMQQSIKEAIDKKKKMRKMSAAAGTTLNSD
jgi:hypothetical protein